MRHPVRAFCLGVAIALLAQPHRAVAADPVMPLPVQGLPAQSHGDLIFDRVPPSDPNLDARIGDYLVGRDASFAAWLPDNSLLVSTRFADVPQIHRVIAPLGMREQLTWNADPITQVLTAPTGAADGFAFLKEHNADGQPQLYYYSFAAHGARMLSGGSGRHGSPLWSPDGKHIVFTGNDRDAAVTDIYMADIAGHTAPRLVVAGRDRPWVPLDWSADGQKLLLWQPGTNDESSLFIADVNTGGVLPAEAAGKHLGIRHARFAADGRGIYISSVDDGDFSELRYLDLVTHQARELTATIASDIEDFQVGVDGRYLAYVTNDNGRDRLTVLDNQSKLELSPAGLPEGRITGLRFDRTGHQLAFSAEGPQSPSDVYVYEPEHNQLTRWTHSEPGAVDPQAFVPAQAVQYPTWDRGKSGQRLIPAFVYRPRSAGPHPVLIDIHDGPAGQFRPGFDAFIQFAVNELGYVVIAPNIRGSTGYGKAFADLDNGPAREDALRDLGALLVWIGMQKDLDRTHVAVMGQSYGGFMALAMLATYNDRLSGGIIVNGYASLPSYLADGAPDEIAARRAEFGDERDPQVRAQLNRLSPLNSLAQIRKPVLVFQGLQDTPAQVQQAGQIVAGIRARGGEAWYVTARNEGHDLRRSANRNAWLATVAQFLRKLAP
ncbi:MAG TPA: alpha/beta fold hydrolase [Steroidobacteraceae bacterium]|jgi:dipeptidyl aminopeptidase/acylaminoacyl peptidase|nr:alpha/beta fold hydrolase [Steroidobacteraceae bacterium]